MSNRFRKLTAWLGMLAIWLAIVAPLVSQANARPAAPRSNAVICGDEHGARPSAFSGAVAPSLERYTRAYPRAPPTDA